MTEIIGGKEALIKYQIEALLKLRKYYYGKLIILTSKEFMPEEWRNIFKDIVEKDKNIIFWDGLTDFHKNAELIFPDKHPNKNGHQLIAKEVFNMLKEHKIIP
jgi:hypothetical protein